MMKKVRDYVITVLGIIVCVAGLLLVKETDVSDGPMRVLPYLMIGVGCGAFGQGAGSIVNRKMTEKDKALAKRIEIEKNDERNIAIGNKAKSKAFDIMIYVFGALMLAYCFMGADITIIIPFVCAYLLVDAFAVYYRIKYDKEM